MRITVQLVNAADGYHLWSERYDREVQDIFEVQDEITLAVVDALNQHIRGELGRIYAASGQRDEALKVLEGLKEQAKSSYLSPVNLAKIYFGLGEREQVFEQLERACAEHSIKLPWFMIDPALDDLRTEPSFQSIVWRVGLPE